VGNRAVRPALKRRWIGFPIASCGEVAVALAAFLSAFVVGSYFWRQARGAPYGPASLILKPLSDCFVACRDIIHYPPIFWIAESVGDSPRLFGAVSQLASAQQKFDVRHGVPRPMVDDQNITPIISGR
jgi:hypothetical protein